MQKQKKLYIYLDMLGNENNSIFSLKRKYNKFIAAPKIYITTNTVFNNENVIFLKETMVYD